MRHTSVRAAIVTAAALFSAASLFSETEIQRREYIDRWSETAMREQAEHGIPASITLAQGIFESASGTSELAVKANNHFGIKCHEWTGRTITHDDDELGECFRAYDNAEQSFSDHSLFLVTRPRYADLFKLDVTDYVGWAKGLKAAGYATNPQYPDRLIEIIERYSLYDFDTAQIAPVGKKASVQSVGRSSRLSAGEIEAIAAIREGKIMTANETGEDLLAVFSTAGHPVYSCNSSRYIVFQEGDSIASLAAATGVSARKLLRLNDMDRSDRFSVGDRIYLERKKDENRTAGSASALSGDTWRSVAQRYGIRLSSLRKMNGDPDREPAIGTDINLSQSF